MLENLRDVYQLKVELKGTKPSIWRQIMVSNVTTLEDFHGVLQIVMGWTNSHLYQFMAGGERYGDTDPELGMDWDEELNDQTDFSIKDLLSAVGDAVSYEYDFGDAWEHLITLEKILSFDASQVLPRCIDGRRACPPEDVGGIGGYSGLLEIWADPTDEEYGEIIEWVGENFQPEKFDETAVNKMLREVFDS